MSEDQKDCGQEGHVCVCAGEDPANSIPNFSMTLEDFLLMRLDMPGEELEDYPESMVELIEGGLLIVAQCIQFVKITAKYDEIAEALKNAILSLDKKFPEHTGLLKMIGLIGINKLESEKKGEDVDWGYAGKLTPDNPFLVEEIKRVFGQ